MKQVKTPALKDITSSPEKFDFDRGSQSDSIDSFDLSKMDDAVPANNIKVSPQTDNDDFDNKSSINLNSKDLGLQNLGLSHNLKKQMTAIEKKEKKFIDMPRHKKYNFNKQDQFR